jgi:hypothetical protein
MRRRILVLLAVGLISGPIVATAQPITVDFTGSIITTAGNGTPSGFYAGLSGGVSGTYTFNYSNANPSYSSGIVGSASLWRSVSYGAAVFTTTVVGTSSTDSGLSFRDGEQAPNPVATISDVNANSAGFPSTQIGSGLGSGLNLVFGAGNTVEGSDPSVTTTDSYLFVASSNLPFTAWDSKGIPNATGTLAWGAIYLSTADSEMLFRINGFTVAPVTRVPEIDPASVASGLTLLLGSLVVLRGRRG